MMENTEYDLIEAYLNGELKNSELEAFEASLNSDTELKKKVDSHKLAIFLVKKNSLLEIKNIIASEDLIDRKKGTYKKIGIGLIISALGVLGIWYYLHSESKPKKNLTDQSTPTPAEYAPEPKETIQSTEEPKLETSLKIAEKSPVVSGNNKVAPLIPDSGISGIPETNTVEIITQHVKTAKPDSSVISVKKSLVPAIDFCATTNIEAHLTITPACEGESNGNIYVSGYKGGKKPYSTEFIDIEHNSKVSPLHLSTGKYEVMIKDANGCSKNYPDVMVKETNCTKDFSLNPFIGDQWEIPSGTSNGTLTVFDESGNVYFRLEIAAGAKEKWNGYSSSGELKTGFFPFTIRYKDGTSKEGSISLGK